MKNQPHQPLPIIAIGASAGGLEAVSHLFDAMTKAAPGKTGMAFIVVQHLDPTHKSLMAELLAEHTTMPVAEASDGALLLADTVTVIPPGRYLTYRNGALFLSPAQVDHGARLPFDGLLASLAAGCGTHVVAVVLSGMGEDGSHGLSALKAAGGYAIAQKPQEADYAGMPSSAVETGLVDEVLALEAIPAALSARVAGMGAAKATVAAGLADIVAFLSEHTPHDFRGYKPGTIGRRIERRMVLLAIGRGDYGAYLALLRERAEERDLLARDLLINVTSFFRDTAVFDRLRETVLPDLVKSVPVSRTLRIWVAGCSTGEEAYSLAMLASDALIAAGREGKVQIFASDVDPDAIAVAREGAYPLDIATTVPADLLKRYFTKDEAGYRVATALRAMVVFSVQDVLVDPPFSRMDMVSCRNLLIYLSAQAQAKVIALFHFALCDGGILLLGTAETVGKDTGRFALIAKGERIYRHVVPSRAGEPGFPFSFGETLPRLGAPGKVSAKARQVSLGDICARAVLGHYAPAAVLVNKARQCLFSMGPTERYLRMAPGYASLDVFAMAPLPLRSKLRLALDRAGAQEPVVQGGRTRLPDVGAFRFEVRYLGGAEELWLIAFMEEAQSGAVAPEGGDPTRTAELEHELAHAQADLQVAIAAQEASHQEQKAINEEALSVNEEFQSTNEELLTSKEELQSLNEELTALNSQLQETLDRQRLTSDDLQNVLYSTNVGTLFLDKDLKIRFYTPAILVLFAVIPSDVGRPLADLRAVVPDPQLLADARSVVADEILIEREVVAPDGYFLRRVLPYRARDGRVEGVVITFADITEAKAIARALEASKLEAERANSAKSRFLAAASHDLRQPLQSLTLLRDLLGRAVEGERPQALLARFDQTLGAMSGMLNTLLDINQIEAGAVRPRPVVFAVSDVLNRLRGEFTTLASARELRLRIMPCAAMVYSDPHLLEQMIRNLLGNAIKYTRHGGIVLGCRRQGDMLRIEVWDTGIGIAADQLHAIFEEFHQVGVAPPDNSRGLGLGLSIVQRLGVLLEHGVQVRSRAGKGSVFAISLPRAMAPVAEALPPLAVLAPMSHPGQHQCKIMVVEDDAEVLDLLEQLLCGQGYSAMGAPDAEAAMRIVEEGAFRPEILLSDYNLPNHANGLDLLANMRARLGQALPAIILSGDISTDTLARIAKADCVQLSKPANPQELIAAIERLCPLGAALEKPVAAVAAVAAGSPVISVIDDDPQILVALREVLEEDGRAVAVYDSAEAFLAAYQPGGEGCVLVDVHLPGQSGVDLLRGLRAKGDEVPLILITGSGGIGLAVEAMRMGACDFIEKPVGRPALLASITRALAQAHDLRVEGAAQEDASALVAGLTRRQREVMRLVLAGHPSKNIAADLGISQRTVENHRAAIMQRMGARSLPELARQVMVADGHG